MQDDKDKHIYKEILLLLKPITLSCGGVAILSTFILIITHLVNWKVPFIQRKIVVIISTVLYFSVDAMISISVVYTTAMGLVMETIRAIYESVLIYNFFQLVSAYISYDQRNDKKEGLVYDRIYQQLVDNKELKQMWPVSYIIKPIKIHNKTQAKKIYSWQRFGVNHFAIINPLLCLVQILIFQFVGQKFKQMKHTKSIFNVVLLTCCSVAIYSLALLLIAFNKNIAHYKPVKKFLTIKLVQVLETFQNTVLMFFPIYDIIIKTNGKERPQGDYLVTCATAIEQMLLSILIWFSYSSKDFNDGYYNNRRYNIFESFGLIMEEQFIDPFVEFGKNLGNSDMLNIGDGIKNRKPLIEKLNRTPLDTEAHIISKENSAISEKNSPTIFEPIFLTAKDDEVKIKIKSDFKINDIGDLDFSTKLCTSNTYLSQSMHVVQNKKDSTNKMSIESLQVNNTPLPRKFPSAIEFDKSPE